MNFTALREAVQQHLQTQFPAADIVGGRHDAEIVSRRKKDHIAVFWPSYDVMERSTSLAQPGLTIRWSPPKSKLKLQSPDDPADLEAAGASLIAAFPRATQVGGYFLTNVACRLTRIVPNDDPETWRVEATLTAYTLSGAA